MTLVRKPLEELMTLPHFVDRFFEEPFGRPARWFLREFEVPSVDIKSTADEIVVEAALPGVKPEAVGVSLDGDVLTIKGTWKHEETKEEAGYHYRELNRGEFSRAIPLPAPVRAADAIATFKDGMLVLTLPKAVAAKPATIEVKAG